MWFSCYQDGMFLYLYFTLFYFSVRRVSFPKVAPTWRVEPVSKIGALPGSGAYLAQQSSATRKNATSCWRKRTRSGIINILFISIIEKTNLFRPATHAWSCVAPHVFLMDPVECIDLVSPLPTPTPAPRFESCPMCF